MNTDTGVTKIAQAALNRQVPNVRWLATNAVSMCEMLHTTGFNITKQYINICRWKVLKVSVAKDSN